MYKDTFDQYVRSYNLNDPIIADSSWLKVVFQLGNVCTYNCSYCNSANKDGSVPWVDIDSAVNIVEEIFKVYSAPPFNKTNFHFELLGGEVTVWKDIDFLLKKIHSLGSETSIFTNASRSIRWWEECSSYLNRVTISFHPEYADREHVVNVGNILAEKNIQVNFQVTMLPELWQKSLDTIQYAVDHGKFEQVTVTKLFKHSTQGKLEIHDWPYTDEQTAWFKIQSTFNTKNQLLAKQDLQKSQGYYSHVSNFWVDSQTGNFRQQSSKLAAVTKQNNWKDWYCYVGIDTLFVHADGRIARASLCKLPIVSYNWKDISAIEWPTDPIKCPYTACYLSLIHI